MGGKSQAVFIGPSHSSPKSAVSPPYPTSTSNPQLTIDDQAEQVRDLTQQARMRLAGHRQEGGVHTALPGGVWSHTLAHDLTTEAIRMTQRTLPMEIICCGADVIPT